MHSKRNIRTFGNTAKTYEIHFLSDNWFFDTSLLTYLLTREQNQFWLSGSRFTSRRMDARIPNQMPSAYFFTAWIKCQALNFPYGKHRHSWLNARRTISHGVSSIFSLSANQEISNRDSTSCTLMKSKLFHCLSITNNLNEEMSFWKKSILWKKKLTEKYVDLTSRLVS